MVELGGGGGGMGGRAGWGGGCEFVVRVCGLANYSDAYEETQSSQVSDFRDFVCSFFTKAILFYFYFTQT